MEAERITHKELLTFSNLANLSWEFLDLKAIKEGNTEYELEGDPSEVTQLNNLLAPEVFQRIVRVEDEEDDYEERRKYIYGGEGYGNYNEKEGRKEMRREAGIAMEYLQKDEGNFLEDWEVVYGADEYKVVTDYLDSLWELVSGEELDDDENLYPTREEIEEEEEDRAKVEFKFNLAEKALKVVFANTSGTIYIPDILKKAGGSKLQEKAEEEDVCLGFVVALASNFGDPKALFESSLSSMQENVLSSLGEEFKSVVGTLEESEQVPEKLDIDFTKEIDIKRIYNSGFRVLALKKDEEVVIVNEGEQSEKNKTLPDELELLQMVYNRLSHEHSDSKITFTGYNGGADLSFINKVKTSVELQTDVA